jgi:hypothetical protein
VEATLTSLSLVLKWQTVLDVGKISALLREYFCMNIIRNNKMAAL